jgi:hypothetical protein
MTRGQRNQYLEQNNLFWGRKNLTRLNEEKIRLVCYIHENISFKRKVKEENSNVILLRIDSGFSLDNIAGLYRPFKLAENETALSQAKIQLRNITNFIQDSSVNLILGDFNLDYKKNPAFDLIQIVKEPTWERI